MPDLYLYMGYITLGAVVVAWATRVVIYGVRAIFFGAGGE